VAVVTGASRGVGRGIALVLGECSATVYVTGRSARGGATTKNQPETIDETAELVTARGGEGIPVRIDHTDDKDVETLFERVRQDQGRLDILVNNVWGGYENTEQYSAPVWEQPIWRWDTVFDAGTRAHFVASTLAMPLMLRHRQQSPGLVVITGYLDQDATHCDSIASIAKLAANGLRCLLAHELRQRNVAVLTVSPIGRIGEWVWGGEELRQVYAALNTPGGLEALHRERPSRLGQSPEYTGRAIAMLAGDPNVMAKTGQGAKVRDLADEYGFTDIDGRRPRHD
jgi:NAD(P)-dependent dehydrogenase (short-subunit alcohol dehydrogenase family)